MKMKKCMLYILLNLTLVCISSNAAAGQYIFRVADESKIYQQEDYKKFIAHITPLFGGIGSFGINIRDELNDDVVVLTIKRSDFSITDINGYNLQDLNVNQYPNDSELNLSIGAFEAAFEGALGFDNLSDPQRITTMMTFAFFFTEGTRFKNIALTSDRILNFYQQRKWKDYKDVFADWSKISSYYKRNNLVPEARGAHRFTTTDANIGTRRIYVNQTGNFVPIYTTMLESWRNLNTTQNSTCEEVTLYNCVVGSALKVNSDLLPSNEF